MSKRDSHPPTSDLATVSAAEAASLNAKIATALSPATVDPYVTNAYTAAQPSVTFTTSPALGTVSDNAVTINFATDNNNGEVACVVVAQNAAF